jgi:hypothetical protein
MTLRKPVQPTGEVHPAANVFPMIEGDELEALVESVRDHGLAEPIWLDADGVLLDGRNRLAACKQAAVAPTFRVYDGDDLVDFIVRLNIHRRHLSVGQKNAAGAELEPIYAAEATRGRPSKQEENGADLPHFPEKPAKKVRAPRARDKAADAVGASPRGVQQYKRLSDNAPDLATAVKANKISTDLGEKLLKLRQRYPDYAEPFIEQIVSGDSKMDLKTATSECRKAKAKADYLARQAEWDAKANKSGDTWEMRHGDFRKMLADLEPGSVDAIITDPPYPDEFLDLWADLADIAAKILRPGAPLIAWSGQYRLQQVLNHLCGPLTYQWTICLDLPGSNGRFRGPNFIQTWKPIIVATNGTWGPHDWFRDRVTSPHKDQDVYEWQQNPEPAADLIERYVPEGGLIVDPFTGVGSFGAAAMATGRRFLGVEIDEGRYAESRQRLTGAAE